jgi:hypothetical protein
MNYVSNKIAERIFLEEHNFIEYKSHFDWNTYGFMKIEIEHIDDPENYYDGSMAFDTQAL